MSDVGRYRRAYPRIFRHPEFKKLTPLGQRFALYVLFGPQSNRIGLFYMSLNTAAEDLGTTADTLRKALAEVVSAFGWSFDAVARVFYIPTWWRWNHPDHGKVLQGNLKDLSEIPPCGLVDAFARNVAYLHPELYETFVEALRIRLGEAPSSQDLSQESVSVQEQKPAALRAVALKKPKTPKPNNLPEVDKRAIRIAEDVVQNGPREATTDYLIDAVQSTCAQSGIVLTRSQALIALTKSQAERSA